MSIFATSEMLREGIAPIVVLIAIMSLLCMGIGRACVAWSVRVEKGSRKRRKEARKYQGTSKALPEDDAFLN